MPSGSTASPSGATSWRWSTRRRSRSCTTRECRTGTSPGISGRRATPPPESAGLERKVGGEGGHDAVLDSLGVRPAELAVEDQGEPPRGVEGDAADHGGAAVDPAGLGGQADLGGGADE